MYHERTLDMLVGVLAIAGLFAAKRYLIDRQAEKIAKQDGGEGKG
jgi:hypothetical protein